MRLSAGKPPRRFYRGLDISFSSSRGLVGAFEPFLYRSIKSILLPSITALEPGARLPPPGQPDSKLRMTFKIAGFPPLLLPVSAGAQHPVRVQLGLSQCQGRVAQIDFGDGGARLCEPQHVQPFENPWNFLRPFGTPCCCGSQTRAPFQSAAQPHRERTPLACGWSKMCIQMSHMCF